MYISKIEVQFPVVMKTAEDDLIKREVTANVIESDEVTFLCGMETLRSWRTLTCFTNDKLNFDKKKITGGFNGFFFWWSQAGRA